MKNNLQLFNAFNPNVYTLQQYRDRLLFLNNQNQAVQVTNLFQVYGY